MTPTEQLKKTYVMLRDFLVDWDGENEARWAPEYRKSLQAIVQDLDDYFQAQRDNLKVEGGNYQIC